MSKTLLIDTVDFIPRIDEAAKENGRFIIEGVFQRADTKNRNGRVYPKSLWEKILQNHDLNERLENRGILGELDHPGDGKTELKRASHILLGHRLNENGEIIGRAEILDTPNGRIAKTLIEAGFRMAVSSRGQGSVIKNNKNEDVVADDFAFDTYDLVYKPSTYGAYPKPVNEDVENNTENKENGMNSREKYKVLEDKAKAVLSVQAANLTEDFSPMVENVIQDLVVEITKLEAEAPELKKLTDTLSDSLTKQLSAIKKMSFSEGLPPFMKKDKEDDKEDDEDKDEKAPAKDKKKDKTVKEDTVGSAETGWTRTIPKEATPTPQGWAFDVNDAGVLADINSGVNEFMNGASMIPESEDEQDVETGEDNSEAYSEALQEIAMKLVSVAETEQNSVARAFAAAYIMESSRRITENESFSKLIVKLQEKFQEGFESGKIIVEQFTDEALLEQYNELVDAFNELNENHVALTEQHIMLYAKVYAETELEKIGLKDNADARKVVAEAIRAEASKKSIDEALENVKATLKTPKPLGVVSRLKEDVNAEALSQKLADKDSKITLEEEFSDAALANKLFDRGRYGRAS